MKRKRHEDHEFTVVGMLISNGRYRAKMTQQELAERSGIPQAEISRLESGYYDTSVGTLHKLAVAMNMRFELSFIDKDGRSL